MLVKRGGLRAGAQSGLYQTMDDLPPTFLTDRLPPLTALRAFEAAARLKSFARAAEELGVTPAAVSQQIQTLETLAGQPLFRRLGRGIELTDAGEAARPLAVEGMALLAEAGRAMRIAHRGLRVSVSASPAFAAKWLTPRLGDFQARHPDVTVWLSADLAMPDFAQADIDLALRFGPGDFDRSNSELLTSESVAPMLAGGLAAGGEPWHRLPLIHDDSPDRDPACPSWPAWFAAYGLAPPEGRGGLRVNRSSLALDAAIAGQGVVLGKQTLAGPDLASGRLVLAPGVQPVRLGFGYWMVWPRGRTLSAGLKAFMAWLREEAGTQDIDVGGGI